MLISLTMLNIIGAGGKILCVSNSDGGRQEQKSRIRAVQGKSPVVLYFPFHACVYKPMENLWLLVVVNHLG